MKLLSGALAIALAAPAGAITLGEAQSLYDRNQVADAEKAFASIAADGAADADDRSSAERQLARIAWLIDGKSDLALRHLEAARGIGAKPCDTGAMIARVLDEAGREHQALDRGPELLASCNEDRGRDEIRTHLIHAHLDLAARNGPDRTRLLREAAAEGDNIVDRADVEGARIRLQAAILTADAEAALRAWRDFFWLEEDVDAPQALLAEAAAARFRKGLALNASTADRLQLAELLMRAGFAEESERYAAAFGLPGGGASNDPVWRKLQSYWDARRKLEAEVLRMNRALARGANKDSLSLDEPAKAAMGALMAATGEAGDPRVVLLKHYGIVGSVGKTSGYPSIHMGHVIEDHADRVTQYGKSADIHFQAIDNMVANGFESWLWDGSAMVGGWTGDGVIVHVRPGYVGSPMRAFRLTYDSPERRELLARQAKRSTEDIAKLKGRPVATLEGLNDRLQLQVVDQIWAGARSRATSEADVKRLFLAEYSKANLNQSIRVHEGRHAIDNTLGMGDNVDQAVLEYDAKLSELALTAYPRMALRNLNRSLEGDGPHDRAGARIFADFAKWMNAHKDEIVGFDPQVAALAQLDKLTDGQIREIARGLDPLARTSGGNPS
ncbi:hypothetical protein [Sphingomonas hankyongi]|uniref:Uncharacterized protein n=1 Tax=Sphingomonas hankyongi TaxID=2908209 RepID=A0ABT0S397_9SPHN|nr:hypothetical protein [Sphingomonas hankyongi]MCL6730338.1 hypothetical protein [Sphingomonas hankyongi]